MKTLNQVLLKILENTGLLKAAVESKDGFNTLVDSVINTEGYKNPIGFAFGRIDTVEVKEGDKYITKTAQCHFPVVNWGNNNGSAALLHLALVANGVKVHFKGNEAVYNLTYDIVQTTLAFLNFYEPEANGEKHKNIQLLKSIAFKLEDPVNNGTTSFHETKRNSFKLVFLFEDNDVESVESAYLKLYALSEKLVPLRSLELNGAFGQLTNVSWVNGIPISLDYLRDNKINLQMDGEYPNIDYTDKFPRLLNHVVLENNIRILDSSKVRFGAQLAAGTTVMPGASYINFNAGTTGAVMVEGRISSSAIVGDGSDVGGGASILGVLSGTDGNPISVGKNTLLGANSTCGIPLGDGCIIDAGLAILEGTKVHISPEEFKKLSEINNGDGFKIKDKAIFKAKILAGSHGLHFRQNSMTGEITASRSTREIKLNADLH